MQGGLSKGWKETVNHKPLACSAMELAIANEKRSVSASLLALTPGNLGLLAMFLLIISGLIFRTYQVSMPHPGVEFLRQWGLPFIVAELAVIFVAMRNGFSLASALQKLPKAAQILLVVFLGTFWVGGAFVSIIPAYASLFNVSTVVHLIFVAALAHSSKDVTAAGLAKMQNAITAGVAIFACMTAAAFIFHPSYSLFPEGRIVWQFAIPGFISGRLFGALVGALLTFAVAKLLVDDENRATDNWNYAGIFLLATLMIWSGTRAAILGFIVAGLIGIFAFRLRIRWAVFARLAVLAAVSTAIAYLLIPPGDTTQDFFPIHFGDLQGAAAMIGGRPDYWSDHLNAYMQSPIFGAGPASPLWIVSKETGRHVQPHNVVLQFLMSWGVVAALSALALLAWAAKSAHLRTLSNRPALPLMLMLYCLLAMSFFDGMLHFAQHTMLAMICFGFLCRTSPETNPQM